MPPTYAVKRAAKRPELNGMWNGPVWGAAETLAVASFRPESSDHRPMVQARLLYDAEGLYGIFRVQDKYVRCVQTEYQSYVSKDSCVEFFVQPKPGRGYLNFEMNCGGTLLLYHITDHERTATGFKEYRPLPWDDGRTITIYHSLPRLVEPEIMVDTEWVLEFAIPFALLAKHIGDLGKIPGATWRANLFKCGDDTSHPHWASWSPVDELNFHLPRCFAPITFAP